MNSKFAITLAAASVLTPIAVVAHAEVYLTADQAVAEIFPGISFERKEIQLSDAQALAIKKSAEVSVRDKTMTVFIGPKKEAVFIDQVIGKHEFITIAVGIKPDGSVAGVEILEYRESYGSQVRHPKWREQFLGKNTGSTLKVDKDIKNISSATLSSVHVTEGVKRLIHTYETLRAAF